MKRRQIDTITRQITGTSLFETISCCIKERLEKDLQQAISQIKQNATKLVNLIRADLEMAMGDASTTRQHSVALQEVPSEKTVADWTREVGRIKGVASM